MKTPAQWMDAYDPAWGDDCGHAPELTEERIDAIQRDAIKDLRVEVANLRAALEIAEGWGVTHIIDSSVERDRFRALQEPPLSP